MDSNQNASGYTNNFAWGTLDLTSITGTDKLTLTDGNATLGAALYVHLLNEIVSGGSVDLSNISSLYNIYYDATLAGNDYLNDMTYSLSGGGSPKPIPAAAVPIPPSALLLGTGLLGMVALRFRRRQFTA